MALKNQTQESATPEDQTAQTEQAAAPATIETVTDAGPDTPIPAAVPAPNAVGEAVEGFIGLGDHNPSENLQVQGPSTVPQETQEQSEIVQEDQSASDAPLVLLGTRKGFPQTAAGNFNLITDVVTDLYNKGVLVITGEGEESSVFFDQGKL